MPWKECDCMSLRLELVTLMRAEGANVAELARRFGVARKTAYKWLRRYEARGCTGLANESRRPRASPRRTAPSTEQAALAVRAAHPCWGGRKIAAVLRRQGEVTPPAPSTITAILHRHQRIDPPHDAAGRQGWQRFEQVRPNDLWQMDFKGHFLLRNGQRCHPLTILDDHSRFNLALRACADERAVTVQQHLTDVFQRFGLPARMLMDNGAPWGSHAEHPWTPLTLWLLRLEIGVTHGRPYHPQTQGKEERFHRTLKWELLRDHRLEDQAQAQAHFNPWRQSYNHERPHEALGLQVPADRYAPSPRAMPATLPPIAYPRDYQVRRVQSQGWISFHGHEVRLPHALAGQPVGLQATAPDGLWQVYYCRQLIGWVDLKGAPRHAIPPHLT
jgi:transposase InsO family protein